MDTKAAGIVYLVGAGPGDPGLLTVRGRELLADCDAVVFDALANPALLPAPGADGRPERHDVGKRGGSAGSARQEEINALLVTLGRSGKRVVRLKGGDPFVFGRGGEEAFALADAGVPFELVPGVSSLSAVPESVHIPVTHRGVASAVTAFAANDVESLDAAALARVPGTLVAFMGGARVAQLAQRLIENGKPAATPAAVVSRGTTDDEQVVVAPLGAIGDVAKGLPTPALVVIGEVVAVRAALALAAHAVA